MSIHSYDMMCMFFNISFMSGAQTLNIIYIAFTLREELVCKVRCVSRVADTLEALQYTGRV